MIVKFFYWQLALVMGFVSLFVEWGGGRGGCGWAHHMVPGEEFELGEVNAHGATNKQ